MTTSNATKTNLAAGLKQNTMADRPRRKVKSTRLRDFWYPNESEKGRRTGQRSMTERGERSKNNAARRSEKPSLGERSPTPEAIQIHQPQVDQAPPARKVIPKMSQATQTSQHRNENDILEEIYTNPAFPTSYSGSLKQFLRNKESISRHKQRIHNFKRRKVYVQGPFQAVQADSIHYRDYRRRNNGYQYILCVVDIFSRKNWVRPMKTVTAEECAKNLDSILQEMEHKPLQFGSDKGSEFDFRHKAIYNILVEKYGLFLFHLTGQKKASMVERFIRTLKTRFERYFSETNDVRWIDVLQDFSKAINNSVNRTIGIEPDKVNFDNREQIYERIYGDYSPKFKCKYAKGDKVRIPEEKHVFTKGYKPNWTKAIFQIVKVKRSGGFCIYKVADSDGRTLDKNFYEKELNLVVKNVSDTL